MRRCKAIEEGFFLLGRMMSCVSLMTPKAKVISESNLDRICLVETTLKQAGIELTPSRMNVFRRFMLVRSSHGLNPSEFTASIAASVRCTFPQALLASLVIRSGKYHGGALPECMKQQKQFLNAESKEEFVKTLIQSGMLFGFGHRIHKRLKQPEHSALGGDPRAAYLIRQAREAFPELRKEIKTLESFAHMVSRIKPSLLPNTDFGAAIFFHCFGFNQSVGVGFFDISRFPGIIAQVINQLDYKANSLRPPLAVNLPYSV